MATTITSGCVSDWGSTAETRVAADSTTGLGDGRAGRGGRETIIFNIAATALKFCTAECGAWRRFPTRFGMATAITSGCVSDWGSTAETRVAADSTTGLGDGRGGRGGRETIIFNIAATALKFCTAECGAEPRFPTRFGMATTITSGCVSDWGSTAETRVAADSTTGLGDGRAGRGGRETIIFNIAATALKFCTAECGAWRRFPTRFGMATAITSGCVSDWGSTAETRIAADSTTGLGDGRGGRGGRETIIFNIAATALKFCTAECGAWRRFPTRFGMATAITSGCVSDWGSTAETRVAADSTTGLGDGRAGRGGRETIIFNIAATALKFCTAECGAWRRFPTRFGMATAITSGCVSDWGSTAETRVAAESTTGLGDGRGGRGGRETIFLRLQLPR